MKNLKNTAVKSTIIMSILIFIITLAAVSAEIFIPNAHLSHANNNLQKLNVIGNINQTFNFIMVELGRGQGISNINPLIGQYRQHLAAYRRLATEIGNLNEVSSALSALDRYISNLEVSVSEGQIFNYDTMESLVRAHYILYNHANLNLSMSLSRARQQYNNINIIKVIGYIFAILISISIGKGNANKIRDEIGGINNHINALKEGNANRFNPIFTETKEIVDSISQLEDINIEVKNAFLASITEMEKKGNFTPLPRFKEKSKVFSLINQAMDNANKKISNISASLGDSQAKDNQWLFIENAILTNKNNLESGKKQVAEIINALKKVEAGNYKESMITDKNEYYPSIKTHYNNGIESLNSFLKELTNTINQNFTTKIEGEYTGELNTLKTSLNRGIDTNLKNIEELKTLKETKETKKIFEPKTFEPKRRETRTGVKSRPGAISPRPTLKDNTPEIDFTGRSFGKY